MSNRNRCRPARIAYLQDAVDKATTPEERTAAEQALENYMKQVTGWK